MKITATMQVTKRCPFVDETDVGTLTLTWNDIAPELHKLGEQIEMMRHEPLTHEEWTARIRAFSACVTIETKWQTGPWAVTCST